MIIEPEVKILFAIYALTGFIFGLMAAAVIRTPTYPAYTPPDPRGSPAFGIGTTSLNLK